MVQRITIVRGERCCLCTTAIPITQKDVVHCTLKKVYTVQVVQGDEKFIPRLDAPLTLESVTRQFSNIPKLRHWYEIVQGLPSQKKREKKHTK
jgi:hypothetical protein